MTRCYSPSSVIRDYFSSGDELTVEAMVERSKKALAHASDRVREKFGFRCLRAAEQLREIVQQAETFESQEKVWIEHVE